ncbi:4-phosphoerythronate dehydrogenase [Alteromonas aestuariivivens]|uniref:Erythronate-4-phosphate dehydrogenase n=1 Tax=Alteromonas aestuariivivens TaxID=1938339 RepID=A0A3D8M4T1_9ALTE|nr:4-phosphoerythronate dehydrogenase [Alteromonas aestuariivivens]RDV24699.1 4-phosphoerythronate dehydrogenase [Alteromonas aestuariivivens]
MKLLFEDSIPFGQVYFAELGDAQAYNWQTLQPQDLKDVDVLAVRSTTRVNSELLAQANALQCVFTATAGTNHIDKTLLQSKNIGWDSAAGCNAVSVAEYVLSALLRADGDGKISLAACKVGIVGAGHVGTALCRLLDALEIPYLLCDPPLQAAGDVRPMVGMEEILKCDVISLHVPFTRLGEYPTAAMIGAHELAALNRNQMLINACRGEVIDERALLERMARPDAPTLVLDVFDNEPEIDTAALQAAWLATPHIAGHSIEGKIRGTQIVYEKICHRFGIAPTRELASVLPDDHHVDFEPGSPGATRLEWAKLRELFFLVYDIQHDDRHFRQAMAKSNQFSALRKEYRIRRECSAFRLSVPGYTSEAIRAQLCGLGFHLTAK